MKDKECYYCQTETEVTPYRNPHTDEIHPTCAQCIKEFTSFAKERSLFTKLGCIWFPALILISGIMLFFNFRIGLLCLAVGVILEIVVIRLQGYFVKKSNIECGTYVDPKKIQWCKTCKYFKKVKNFDDLVRGLWREKAMPNQENIPCKIFEKTKEIWKGYFDLEENKRATYPRNCTFWEKR